MNRPRLAITSEPDDHERLFIARYARVWRHALRVTGEAAAADDLTQEAFLRFTLAKPDLSRIDNLDGYLSILVRNVHLSRVRRASHRSERPLDPLEYDSARLAASHSDPRAWLLAREQVRAVCAYGCQRRHSAKTGSVFLLRFFHALVPSEIARVANAAGRTVEEWIRLGRQEARQIAADPSRLSVIARTPRGPAQPAPGRDATDAVAFCAELRDEIFSHRHAECFSDAAWTEMYSRPERAIPTDQLAAIVTCPDCLERALGHHGLPRLSERSPFDGGGRSFRPKAPSTGRQTRHHRLDRLEHRPRALVVAVNGFTVGREHVSGNRSEMAVSVTLAEPIGFVELLSEQDVCLLHLVVEPPPTGDVLQKAWAMLSDGRSVELEISFERVWPTVRAAYLEPSTADAPLHPSDDADSSTSGAPSRRRRWIERAASWVRAVWDGTRPGGSGRTRLRPAYGIAGLLIAGLAGYAIVELVRPTVTAAEALRDAKQSERAWVARPDHVAYRVVRLQERVVGASTIRSQRRIETWYEASGLKATRVYDDTRLLAGEWQRADGSRTVYRSGAAPAIQTAPQDARSITPDDVWRHDVTAEDFAALVGTDAGLTVETGASQLLLRANDVSNALVSATLVVSPETHRAIGQVLVVRVGETLLEYRFEVAQADRVPAAAAPKDRFEPDAALVVAASATASAVPAPAASSVSSRVAAARLDGLELSATGRLYRLGPCLATPGRIERDLRSVVRIDVIAAGEACRAEALSALASLAAEDGVAVTVRAVPTGTRVASVTTRATASITDDELTQLPVYPLLFAHYERLAARGDATVDLAASAAIRVRQLVLWTRGQSTELVARARALRQLNRRWTAATLDRLDSGSRAVWQQLVREHVVTLAANADLLRLQLEPALMHAEPAPDAASPPPLRGVDDARAEVERLCALVEVNDRRTQAWLRPALDRAAAVEQESHPTDGELREMAHIASRFGEDWTLER